MPIIEGLEQGTQKWLEYRQARVMASDISIILGNNPWDSKLDLWEMKLGLKPPKEMNDDMRRGHLLEPEARELASSLIGIDFLPIVYESDKYPWLAASLDGISQYRKYILEIKCPKEKTHLEAIEGVIASYYKDQIQTQLLVTGAEICYYFSYRPEYDPNPYAIEVIYPDLEKHAEIISKGQQFYLDMCTMNPPEEWKLELRK